MKDEANCYLMEHFCAPEQMAVFMLDLSETADWGGWGGGAFIR